MCRTIMETTSKFTKPDYLRPGSKPRWNLLHVSAEDKATREHGVRKHGWRKQKRSQKAKHAALMIETAGSLSFFNQEKQESSHQARVAYQLPTGAMAPKNTTQYLMRNVYEDEKIDETQLLPPEASTRVYCESLSPKSVSAALDSYYDGILAFQLRDFEELFGLTWQPE